eukprot:CAMPEP_0178411356 /NCGR_PEP_ID=MMETSP0689_2-20121128/21453_1 /TAXON_ID=160604 /ORGANISM="Amphidinium massartii, Strain CS-259" /LENGTH=346 /DNA_ID=CAMNT_0020032561 /DNA_START=67 /DNA_END=1107 /DNA_ORIENTATION=+
MTFVEVSTSFTLVVKNTFLELVENDPAAPKAHIRRRSHGDLAEVASECSRASKSTLSPSQDDAGEESTSSSCSFSDFCESSLASPVTSSSLSECAVRPGPLPVGLVRASTVKASDQWPHPQQEAEDVAGTAVPLRQIQSPPLCPALSSSGSASTLCLSTRPTAAGKPRIMPPTPAQREDSFPNTRTTVMLRGLPATMTRATLIMLLDCQGLKGMYDFVYMPMDFSAGKNLNYAFVNLLTPAHAAWCFQHLDGLALPPAWVGTSNSSLSCTWSDHQGLKQHVDKYRSSPVMHPSIPDEWKPVIMSNGHRVPFPRPTKHIKAPRHNKLRGATLAAAAVVAAGPPPAAR